MKINKKNNDYLKSCCSQLLLPIMLINITVGENGWGIGGVKLSVPLYILSILISYYLVARTPYFLISTGLLLFAILIRIADQISLGGSYYYFSYFPLSCIYVLAGASIYGQSPSLLHKHLVGFLVLSVPIMIAQKLGISQWLMLWDTSFLDDSLSSFTNDDVGKFKDIALYPTLFVNLENINFVIGQARPAGLTHNNNILSIFIALAIPLNLAMNRLSHLNLSDIFLTTAAILSMSKLVFGVAAFFYVGYIIFGSLQKKIISLRLFLLFTFGLILYYIIFPGLFLSNLSEGMVLVSILLRLTDLLGALGIADMLPLITALGEVYSPGSHYEIGKGYTLFATLLINTYAAYIIVFLIIFLIFYYFRSRSNNKANFIIHRITFIACILTQFGVPFYQQNSFQLIIGFSLYPIFKKLWFTEKTVNNAYN